jgi:pimeloyl-ACP methyl ester carboxylesterase
MTEPIVLIGGFGSHWTDYRPGARLLANLSGRRVFIAGITRVTWMMAGLVDYSVLVDRAHAAIMHALNETGERKVILVGHSAGGIVGRAYLGGEKVKPHHSPHLGYERVSRLVMVGSPLKSSRDALRPGMKAAAWVDETYPGAYFAPDVQYLNVRSRYIEGKLNGTLREREAYFNYRFISNRGEQWGDGVVPLSLSELDGATTLEVEGIGHSPGWPNWFFSSISSLRSWWHTYELGDAPVIDHSRMLA